jgi:hypothetical protein
MTHYYAKTSLQFYDKKYRAGTTLIPLPDDDPFVIKMKTNSHMRPETRCFRVGDHKFVISESEFASQIITKG